MTSTTRGTSRVGSNLTEFDPVIVKRAEAALPEFATPHQRVLAALIDATIMYYRRQSIRRQLGRAWQLLLMIPAAFVISYGALWLGRRLIDTYSIPSGNLLLISLSTLVLVGAFLVRLGTTDNKIAVVGKPIRRLRLGRMEGSSDLGRMRWSVVFLSVMFGLQTGLMQFTNFGQAENYGLRDSLLLTLDNILHGLLLDVCELYNIRFGPQRPHNPSAATLFFLFRLGFDVLVGVMLYLWYRSYELDRLCADFPVQTLLDSHVLCTWIDDVQRSDQYWINRFGAECVFLELTRAFLEDRFEDVLQISAILPAVKIDPSVRNLFRDSFGHSMLPELS